MPYTWPDEWIRSLKEIEQMDFDDFIPLTALKINRKATRPPSSRSNASTWKT